MTFYAGTVSKRAICSRYHLFYHSSYPVTGTNRKRLPISVTVSTPKLPSQPLLCKVSTILCSLKKVCCYSSFSQYFSFDSILMISLPFVNTENRFILSEITVISFHKNHQLLISTTYSFLHFLIYSASFSSFHSDWI